MVNTHFEHVVLKPAKTVGNIFGISQRWFLFIATVAVALGMFAEVVLRLGGLPLPALEDIILYCLGWLYFIGAAVSFAEGKEIKAEVLPVFMKNPYRLAIAGTVTNIMALAFMVWLCILSYSYLIWVVKTGQESVSMRISYTYAAACLPVGFSLSALYMLNRLLRQIINLFRGRRHLASTAENKLQEEQA